MLQLHSPTWDFFTLQNSGNLQSNQLFTFISSTIRVNSPSMTATLSCWQWTFSRWHHDDSCIWYAKGSAARGWEYNRQAETGARSIKREKTGKIGFWFWEAVKVVGILWTCVCMWKARRGEGKKKTGKEARCCSFSRNKHSHKIHKAEAAPASCSRLYSQLVFREE